MTHWTVPTRDVELARLRAQVAALADALALFNVDAASVIAAIPKDKDDE